MYLFLGIFFFMTLFDIDYILSFRKVAEQCLLIDGQAVGGCSSVVYMLYIGLLHFASRFICYCR